MDKCLAIDEMKRSLIGVTASLLQTSSRDARKWGALQKVLVAKGTGVLTTSTIYGLVATLGTAGTGTAIGTLSGAAAHSATMAWIGNVFGLGFGMVGGAILLPAAGILAGILLNRTIERNNRSRPRKLSRLEPHELEILYCAFSLLQALNALAEDVDQIPSDDFNVFVGDGIAPLCRLIASHHRVDDASSSDTVRWKSRTLSEEFLTKLAESHGTLESVVQAFPREIHAKSQVERISWYRRLWLSFFGRNARRERDMHLASAVLASTFHLLLEEQPSALRKEQALVIDAMRRRRPEFVGRSLMDLSRTVQKMDKGGLESLVRDTRQEFTKLVVDRALRGKNARTRSETQSAQENKDFDVEFCVDRGRAVGISILEKGSSARLARELCRLGGPLIPLSEQMGWVVDAIDKPNLSRIILNQSFFRRLFELEEEGALSEVSEDTFDSVLLQTSVRIYLCLNEPEDQKRDYATLLQNGLVGLGGSLLVEEVAEFFSN